MHVGASELRLQTQVRTKVRTWVCSLSMRQTLRANCSDKMICGDRMKLKRHKQSQLVYRIHVSSCTADRHSISSQMLLMKLGQKVQARKTEQCLY